MGILSREQIEEMGFASVGDGAKLSEKASYSGCSNIHIGKNTRIDDFAVLCAGAGGIYIGNHVHIGIYASLIGEGKIEIQDFGGVSAHTSVSSAIDAPVTIGRHSGTGAGAIVLPGTRFEEVAVAGSLSVVTEDCKAFGMYRGNPARYICDRKKILLDLEQQLVASTETNE